MYWTITYNFAIIWTSQEQNMDFQEVLAAKRHFSLKIEG
jgi:hypothetical protein